MGDKDEFELTPDETNKLKEALEQPEFRELLLEYVRDISDPATMKLREEELRALEAESNGGGGGDVTFVHPTPGFCVKTCDATDASKVFVNVCSAPEIDEPVPTPEDGGVAWAFPYAVTHPREDVDAHGATVRVFDVVFHPSTVVLAGSTPSPLRDAIVTTALDGIASAYGVAVAPASDNATCVLNRKKYYGVPRPAVIRGRSAPPSSAAAAAAAAATVAASSSAPATAPVTGDDKARHRPQLTDEEIDARLDAARRESEQRSAAIAAGKTGGLITELGGAPVEVGVVEPRYKVVHQGEFDMREHLMTRVKQRSTRPARLVVTIELPRCPSAAPVDLDLDAYSLTLTVPNLYALSLTLPFPVDDDAASARFVTTDRVLQLTLPVVPGDVPALPDAAELEDAPAPPPAPAFETSVSDNADGGLCVVVAAASVNASTLSVDVSDAGATLVFHTFTNPAHANRVVVPLDPAWCTGAIYDVACSLSGITLTFAAPAKVEGGTLGSDDGDAVPPAAVGGDDVDGCDAVPAAAVGGGDAGRLSDAAILAAAQRYHETVARPTSGKTASAAASPPPTAAPPAAPKTRAPKLVFNTRDIILANDLMYRLE